MELAIEPLEGGALPALMQLLQASGLPSSDLADAHATFLGAFDGEGLAGVVGVENCGGAGLLRSLAVREPMRGSGLGARLVAAAERMAAEAGLDSLALLTTTAAPFFERQGYVPVDRAMVADSVRQSAEFRSICPATATCMHKRLHGLASAPNQPPSS